MKRCPQCEFIYEEEQKNCDMDGALLVHDPRALLDTARVRSNYAHRSSRKLFVQLALPLAILATLSFYALRSSHSSNPAAAAGVNGSQPQQISAPSSVNTNLMNASSGATGDASHASTASNESGTSAQDKNDSGLQSDDASVDPQKKNSATNSSPFSSSKRSSTRPQSRMTPAKKDSKVTSFLKKTGKFFKKPFER